MSRLQLYIASSAVLANIVLLRAYYERPNFYSAAVYISQSTGSLMFLINLGLIVVASLGYGLQRLFYGPLRLIETEQLYDKAWFAVSESLLAMTIFRDEIGISFFAKFLMLLAGKVWQWIGEGRVEFLEQQPPANPRLFHARLSSSLILSVAYDLFMMNYCIDSILRQTRPGVMVMFGFEYVLLAVASISTLLRYTLSLVELFITHRQEKAQAETRRLAREARERAAAEGGSTDAVAEEEDDDEPEVPGWEEKGRWVFYLDLLTDFHKSVVYLGFFMVLMAFYGIPIHIMRDLFMTVRSFIKRINDFVRYRNATRDMNARYPDATAEELGRENTCIVCREEMEPYVENPPPGTRRRDEKQRPKKLPCGHILHMSCLRNWLERQQVCPTCRRPVLAEAARPNNPAPGQQNPANPQNNNPFGILPAHLANAQPPQAGQQGQPGQQGGQAGRPVGNLRVFNLGPIRIALGNIRLPPNNNNQQQQAQVNDINNNNNLIANLAQQLAQNQNQNQGANQAQPQNLAVPQVPLLQGLPMAGVPAHHPADIQTDILRLQQNIIDSLRQLSSQHNQLEYIHALLGELNRLQQASGITAANGQELPPIAPLNPQISLAPITPQAYFSNGPILRQGDAGLPQGLVLPEGWTLRPMALTQQAVGGDSQEQASTPQPPPPPAASAASTDTAGATRESTTSGQPEPAQAQPSSSEAPSASGSAAGPSSKTAEPSSLTSSWSFGNAPGDNEAEGSSSAMASSSSEGATRRSATVEDAEDNGQ